MFFYVGENDIGTRAIAEAAIATQVRAVPSTNCSNCLNFVQVWFCVYTVHAKFDETHFLFKFSQCTLLIKNILIIDDNRFDFPENVE